MVQRAVQSFFPSRQPWGTQKAYRQELICSGTMPVAVAMLEGGVVAVMAKTVFEANNLAFATIWAAPMFANLTSLFWTRAARGRRKPAFVAALMGGLLGLVALVALLPLNAWGGAGLVAIVVAGRCLMAGIVTVRSAVWRMNYPRAVRAKVTGKFVLIAAALLGSVPLGVGLLLDQQAWAFRLLYPAAALVGVVGAVAFARIRVRQERQLLKGERRPHDDAGTPRRADGRRHGFVSVLREDHNFRAYMTWQFFAGTSNMMGWAAFGLFVLNALEDHPHENLLGMTLNTSLPLAVATLTVPWWSRLLDRTHIATYRIGHGLTWVVGQSLCFVAALGGELWLFFGAMVLKGLMQGGGMIAWNLGHNDFADKRLAVLYMGIHQTLTGVRGVFAPYLGVALLSGWEGFSWWGGDVPPWEGIGGQVFIITTALAVVAWLGFWSLSQRLRAQGRGGASDG